MACTLSVDLLEFPELGDVLEASMCHHGAAVDLSVLGKEQERGESRPSSGWLEGNVPFQKELSICL